ncbi:MAG TPA: hypothetical protein VFN85_12490 [Solirubrobacterales bacterium]|nr:hypothetical protein [Solirubrobacterales bacterium]
MRRLSTRILVALTLCAALAAFALVPIPEDANGHPVLPAVALEQVSLYRLEIAVMVFYGGLLLITPVFSGLVTGRLPIEISARGARFAEDADQFNDIAVAAIQDLEEADESLSEALGVALSRIEALERLSMDDNTQPKVESHL